MTEETKTPVHDDYFTLLTGLGMICVGVALLVFGPWVYLALLLWTAALGLSAVTATYILDRAQRVKLLSASAGAGWLGVCAIWPWTLGDRRTPLLLGILGFLVAVIGRTRLAHATRGAEAANAVTAAMNLTAARAELGTMAKAVGLPEDITLESEVVEGGTVRQKYRMPAGVVANAAALKGKLASYHTRGESTVRTWVPDDDNGVLMVELVDWDAFDHPIPCPAARAGVLHMGWFRSGKILNLDVEDESAGHMLAAGITGSGKSETLRTWIAQWLQQILVGVGVKVWAADPSGGKSLRKYRRFYERFATTPADGVELLRLASEEVERRYQLMALDPEEPETWPGDWLAVAVDELPQLLAHKVLGADDKWTAPAAEYVRNIVSRGRGARVAIGAAALSPRAGLLGGDSKAQFPHRFAHHMTKAEVNIGLDIGALSSLDGRGPHLIKDKGRAFCRLPSMSTFPEAQVFMSPPADLLERWKVPVLQPVRGRQVEDELDEEETDLRPGDLGDPHVTETPAYAPAREQVTGRQVTQPAGAGHPAGSSSAQPLGKWGEQILAVLREAGADGLSGRRVAELAGCSLSVAQSTLKRLEGKQLVWRSEDVGVTVWRLAGDERPPAPSEDEG